MGLLVQWVRTDGTDQVPSSNNLRPGAPQVEEQSSEDPKERTPDAN